MRYRYDAILFTIWATVSFSNPAIAGNGAVEPEIIKSEGEPTLRVIDPERFNAMPLRLSNGVSGQVLHFQSRNPEHFRQWIEGNLGAEVTLGAQLFAPENAQKLPLVIMVPGSAGIGPHHLEQASRLVESGFGVLLIDPLYGRSVASTVADQSEISWSASVFDIFAAIEAVSGYQAIDTARIGLLGSSRGGFAIISALMEQITQRFSPPGAKILAGFAGYPWCGLQFWQPRLSPDAVLHVFSGDQDDWVSVQQCQDLVHALAQQESGARIKILSGAFHAFDRTGFPPTELPEVPSTIRFPTVYMDDNGYFLDPATGLFRQDLNADFFDRQVLAGGFVKRGVTVGSRDGDAQSYVSEMLEFFTRELKKMPREGVAK